LDNKKKSKMLNFIHWGLSWGILEEQIIPAAEQTLILYVTWLARTLTPSSIRGYLAVAVELQLRSGYLEFKETYKSMSRLKQVMDAIHKQLAHRTGKQKKAALEPKVISQMAELLYEPESKNVMKVAITAFLVSFWSTLRADN